MFEVDDDSIIRQSAPVSTPTGNTLFSAPPSSERRGVDGITDHVMNTVMSDVEKAELLSIGSIALAGIALITGRAPPSLPFIGSGGSANISTSNPQPLGVAAPGTTKTVSDAGHIHAMPTAVQVGADPAGTGAAAGANAIAVSNAYTALTRGINSYSASGVGTAGPISVPGAVVGDVIKGVLGFVTATGVWVGLRTTDFEGTVTVVNQIQQTSVSNLAPNTYIFITQTP